MNVNVWKTENMDHSMSVDHTPPPSSYNKYIKKGNLECYFYIYIE